MARHLKTIRISNNNAPQKSTLSHPFCPKFKIYVLCDCVVTYKAKAELMGIDEDDILPIESISLKDNGDNSTLIAAVDGYPLDVTLQGRTLYKDRAWNTLCLPFKVELEGSPLEGAIAKALDSGEVNGTTTRLTFSDAARTLRTLRAYFQFTDEIGSEARDIRLASFKDCKSDTYRSEGSFRFLSEINSRDSLAP